MMEITAKELNAEFDATLSACSTASLGFTDDLLEVFIFEDFDVGITSFLHESSLQLLLDAGYIDNCIKEKCVELRKMALSALKNHRSVIAFRTHKEWEAIIQLSDQIKELKTQHEESRS